MKPIVIKGHERPLTQIKFNREGDIFISTARDTHVSVWFSDNGERLGTLGPHTGAVMSVDLDATTSWAVTGSGDMNLRLWNLRTGENLAVQPQRSTPRFVELNPLNNNELLVVLDEQMGHKGTLLIMEVDAEKGEFVEKAMYEHQGSPYVQASWAYDGKRIVAAHRDGSVSRIIAKTGEVEDRVEVHSKPVTDLQMSLDRTYFVTSSRDATSSLLYVDGPLEVRKTYKGDVPLNSAAITPVKDLIIAGGGMDARDVTTSASGKFESHFFHKIFMDDLGRLGGHFGPINCIGIHPRGTCYASGSEDGYVRLHHFDKSFFDFELGKPPKAVLEAQEQAQEQARALAAGSN